MLKALAGCVKRVAFLRSVPRIGLLPRGKLPMTNGPECRYNVGSRLGRLPMHQVQLNERIYKEAERRAAEAGFSTVDEYVADVVSHDLVEDAGGETPNLDHLFTPEVIADLDKISAEIKAGGKTYTMEEVDEHFEKKRQEWLRNHAG
jgi:hypothetical protein